MSTPPTRQTVQVTVANLTSAQAWALRELLTLWTDPVNCDDLARVVAGTRAVRIDSDTGRLRLVRMLDSHLEFPPGVGWIAQVCAGAN